MGPPRVSGARRRLRSTASSPSSSPGTVDGSAGGAAVFFNSARCLRARFLSHSTTRRVSVSRSSTVCGGAAAKNARTSRSACASTLPPCAGKRSGRCWRQTTVVCGSSSSTHPLSHGPTSGRPAWSSSDVIAQASTRGRVSAGYSGMRVVAASMHLCRAGLSARHTRAAGPAWRPPASSRRRASRRCRTASWRAIASSPAFFPSGGP